jgi:uncharacterized protein (DUF885 family)
VIALPLAFLLAAPAWVEKSNEHAKVLLDVVAQFQPEAAGGLGIDGLDDRITDFSDAARDKAREARRRAQAELERRLKAEKDALVRQDLEILVDEARRHHRSTELGDKLTLPYAFAARVAFEGVRALLDDQVAPERRKQALVRLRRYAGMEDGYRPMTQVVRERTAAKLAVAGLQAPYRGQLEEHLAQSGQFLDGIGQLFAKYKVEGYQDSLGTLRRQVAEYNEFVAKQVLPRARDSFRIHPDLYASALQGYGVDVGPDELIKMARASFIDLQSQMRDVAAKLARERGWSSTDYRFAIRELKREQIMGEAILPHYRARLKEIEGIVRREGLVSLPDRDARIRIATPAETAASPAPNMRPPRLIGNTGEMGEFVLPLNVPGKSGPALQYDDFTFAAASWSLAAHELRPGHEMQFARMVERGVSNARAIFAFNSANVEGWGLYSEAIMLPHMPLEGQLVSLDYRLLRAARAFLDPELQLGRTTVEEAKRVLEQDVACSPAMAKQETDRYTFRAPGQATSYFYGYVRLMELRRGIEKRMGARFDARAFHDFVLEQGLLPPGLLRKAVEARFQR